MQIIRVESEQIRLPPDVFYKLKGRQIRFVESSDGFLIEPVSEKTNPRLSKLANLKRRKLIIGEPDEILNIRVGEWNEPDNLYPLIRRMQNY